MTPAQALKELRKRANNNSAKVASWAGRSRQAVSNWRKIPVECVLKLEANPDIGMSRYQMRRDIYGDSPNG